MTGVPYIPPRQIAKATRDKGAAWTDEKSYRPDPFKALGESWNDDWATRLRRRAATPSGRSLLHVSGIAGIAVAVLCIAYFVAEFLR